VHKSLRFFPFVLISFILLVSDSYGQIGGVGTYKLLYSTNSARVAGMGGNFLAIKDNDIDLAIANPSLITPEMHNNLALNFINFAGIGYGYVAYSRTFNKVGSFVGTFQFVDYGKFTYADEAGNTSGDFHASDYALTVGWGRQLGPHFSIGANGKLIYSNLESYHSFGIAVDAAGTYSTTDNLFTASLLARNIGVEIVPYMAGMQEPVPFQLQAGMSVGLRHIPLRFSFLYNHIEKWDLTYDDPNDPNNQKDPITGEVKTKSGVSQFADNLMRHIVLGTELTIAKILSLRIGYDYQQRQELKLYSHAGLSGFTFGAGIRIKMFSISYSRDTYMAGPTNPNYFTVGINLGAFSKKKEVKE
jgi:hypothetical protein